MKAVFKLLSGGRSLIKTAIYDEKMSTIELVDSHKKIDSGQFSGYISPQNFFTHFICSVRMSKKLCLPSSQKPTDK